MRDAKNTDGALAKISSNFLHIISKFLKINEQVEKIKTMKIATN